jgi:type III pantothenate kinase
MSILLIDAGNTRTKWAIAQSDSFNVNDRFVHFGTLESSKFNLNFLKANEAIQYIVCTSVLNTTETQQIKNTCLEKLLDAQWHQINGASAQEFLPSAYASVKQLGADRRALLLGAQAMFPHRNVLIVCSGTATTYDLLSREKKHLGGWIIPGIDLMKTALAQGTAGLPQLSISSELTPLTFGIDTQEGMFNGILASQLGTIEMAKASAHKLNIKLDAILVDGGNAELLISRYSGQEQMISCPHLVLKGLLAWHHMGYK